MKYTEGQIARVIYEMHRTLSQISSRSFIASDWANVDPLMREYARLLVRKIGEGASPAEFHSWWSSTVRRQGWKYGDVFDSIARTTPDLIPYEDLPEDIRDKDRIVWAVVRMMTGKEEIRAEQELVQDGAGEAAH